MKRDLCSSDHEPHLAEVGSSQISTDVSQSGSVDHETGCHGVSCFTSYMTEQVMELGGKSDVVTCGSQCVQS